MSRFLEASPLTALTNALFGFATRAFAGGLTTVPALIAWPGYALATIVVMMVSGMVSPISTTGFDSSNALGIIIASIVVLSLLLGSASLLRRWTTSHWGIEAGALGGVFSLIGETSRGLRRTLIFAAGTVLVSAIISGLAPNFRSFTAGVVYIAVIVIAAMLAIIITLAGRPHRGTAGVPMSVEDPLFIALSAVFGQRDNGWVAGRVEVYEGSQILISPPSASGTWLANLTANVALHLPSWEVREASAARVVLVPLSAETRENRELVASSAGLVTSVFPVPASIGTGKTMALKDTYDDLTQRGDLERSIQQREGSDFTVSGFPLGRWMGSDGVRQGRVEVGLREAQPRFFDAQEWTVVPTAKSDALEAIAAREGRTLVEFVPAAGRAVVARLDPWTALIRQSFARAIKVPEHEVSVRLEWAVDAEDGSGRIDSLALSCSSKPLSDDLLAALLELVPGPSRGWKTSVEALTGEAVMTYGKPPHLRELVPAREVLLNAIDPTAWYEIPFGMDPNGATVSLNLKAGPHSVVVGGTGAGKTVAVRAMLASAISRGFDVLAVDPIKKTAGLQPFGPFSRGMFKKDDDGFVEAAAALTAVYAEVRRRVNLIDAVDGENWLDIPEATRPKPLLVFIDEYASLGAAETKPLDSKSDAFKEWAVLTTAKETIKSMVGKMAREARSAGVHLVIGLQRADTTFIPGSVRENLGTVIHMIPPASPPSADSLKMLFNDQTAAAVEQMHLFESGAPGLALAVVDGGKVGAFRTAFLDKTEIEPYLVSIGAPLRTSILDEPEEASAPLKPRVVLPKPDQSVFNIWDAEHAAEATPPAPATSPAPLRPPGAPGALK